MLVLFFVAKSPLAANELKLTAEQILWLEKHPHIKVGVPVGMQGLSDFNKKTGTTAGIFIDYLNLITEKANIDLEIITLPWPKIIESAKKIEIDIFPGIQTPERSEYMNFTREFYSVPYVLVTQSDAEEVEDTQWLEGKQVSVIENTAIHGYLKKQSNVTILTALTVEEALRDLSFGRTDGYFGDLLTVERVITEKRIANLKVAAPAGFETDAIRLAVRKDWPELQGILDQAIASIDDQSHHRILDKWLVKNEVNGVSWPVLLKWLGAGGLLLIIIFSTIVFWNWQLQRTVEERTTQLANEKERLAVSEEQQRLLQEATSDGIWDWDVQKNQVYWSARTFEMLGYEMNAFKVDFEVWKSLVHPEDIVKCSKKVRETLKTGKALSIEFRYKMKDGTWLWILSQGYCVATDTEGKATRILGTHLDLSERKVAQAQLRAQNLKLAEINNELRRSNKMAQIAIKTKDEFLAVISHELRTPLNPILGFSDVILEDLPFDSPLVQPIEVIRESSLRMLKLVDDILNFTRIQKDELKPAPSPFSLQDTIDHCISDCNSNQECKSEIRVENGILPRLLPYDLTQKLVADSNMIRQVVINLLANACKYSDGAPVILRVGFIADTENILRIEVVDQGIGISSEQEATIFDAFYQVDSSFSRRYEGLGLGLATCKKIVDLNNGTIGVESEVGKGSTFWFQFPIEKIAPNQLPGAQYPHFKSSWKILVAEDQESNRAIIQQIIQRLGATVKLVRNGKAAIDSLEEADYDFILMDLSMPEMDGFEAAIWIRENGQNKDIPIIALTAHDNEMSREKAKQAKMNGYIVKPINVSIFAPQIEQILEST